MSQGTVDTSNTESTENDQVDEDSTDQQAPEEQDSTEGTGGESDDEGEEQLEEESEEEPEDELPEWARKELTKVRAEAANYRTRLRDAETQLKEAKTPEEYEAAINEFREQNAKLERQVLVNSVARKYHLPDDLAEVLQGDTEKELTAHAKKLAKYASVEEPQDLSGGLTPGDGDGGPSDPATLAQMYGRGRRR